VTDVPVDLPVWCHLTGHTYLDPVGDPDQEVYALRLTPSAMLTRPDAPWCLAIE